MVAGYGRIGAEISEFELMKIKVLVNSSSSLSTVEVLVALTLA